jgi:hypothetical protein
MDRTSVKQIKELIKLMHAHGITHLKVDGIELTLPHPKPPIKTQIMAVSPQEKAAIQSAYGNHKHAMELLNKKSPITAQTEFDELDSILFAHESF